MQITTTRQIKHIGTRCRLLHEGIISVIGEDSADLQNINTPREVALTITYYTAEGEKRVIAHTADLSDIYDALGDIMQWSDTIDGIKAAADIEGTVTEIRVQPFTKGLSYVRYIVCQSPSAVVFWYRNRRNAWEQVWLPGSLIKEIDRTESTITQDGYPVPYNTEAHAVYTLTTDVLFADQLQDLEALLRSHDIRADLAAAGTHPDRLPPISLQSHNWASYSTGEKPTAELEFILGKTPLTNSL